MKKSLSLTVPALLAIFNLSASAEIKYVLHITCDGLRGDLVKALVTASPTLYPNFKKFIDEGATTFNARCDYDYSETIPNHSSIVTGRPVLDPAGSPAGTGHAFTANFPATGDTIHKMGSNTYAYKVSTFDTAHDRGLSTAIYAGKTRINLFVDSYSATNGRVDTIGADNGKNKVDVAVVADNLSAVQLAVVKTNVVAAITAGTLKNYNLVHFTDTDTGTAGGGHNVSWGTTAWNNAVKDIDGYLGALFTAVAAAPAPLQGQIALVLTADHGGGGTSTSASGNSHTLSSHVSNYVVPLLLWGPGIPAGMDAHRLFSNRTDPALARPNSTATTLQPLRNVDTGNISMGLLGLPAIEGSYYKPTFATGPTIAKEGVNTTIKWPEYLHGYKLQTNSDLATGTWVDEAIVPTDNTTYYSRPAVEIEPRKFYRLVGP